jgi:hypothetical protein
MNPTNATTAELTSTSNEELTQIEGGVSGDDGGCTPTLPILKPIVHIPTFPTGPEMPVVHA